MSALLLWGVASSLSLSLSLLGICRWWEFEAGKRKLEEEQDWLLKWCTISLCVMAVRGNGGRSMGICIELPFVHGLWLWSHSEAKILWTWYKGRCSESQVSLCCNTLFFFFHIICQVTFWEQLLIYDFLFYSLKWSIVVSSLWALVTGRCWRNCWMSVGCMHGLMKFTAVLYGWNATSYTACLLHQ